VAKLGRDHQDRLYGKYEVCMSATGLDSVSEAKVNTAQIPSVLYYGPAEPTRTIVGWGHDIVDALAPTGYPKPGIVCP